MGSGVDRVSWYHCRIVALGWLHCVQSALKISILRSKRFYLDGFKNSTMKILDQRNFLSISISLAISSLSIHPTAKSLAPFFPSSLFDSAWILIRDPNLSLLLPASVFGFPWCLLSIAFFYSLSLSLFHTSMMNQARKRERERVKSEWESQLLRPIFGSVGIL